MDYIVLRGGGFALRIERFQRSVRVIGLNGVLLGKKGFMGKVAQKRPAYGPLVIPVTAVKNVPGLSWLL
jgi:hypothetical protein